MRMYNVESQSKYHIKVTEIENLEDATEAFITEDELNEMGVEYVSTWRPTTFDKKIKRELNRLKRKIEKSTANSCKIDDEELVDCFKETETAVSDYVKGLRRVGNRLSIHTKAAKTKANKRDGKRFVDSAIRFISRQVNESMGIEDLDFCIEVRGGMENVHEGTFDFIRHNMTWENYEGWVNDQNCYNGCDEEEMKWRKVMYDDPKYFTE